jgi:hypothetical protein
LEAIKGFKAKGRFPSKSVQKNSIRKSVQRTQQGTSEKFDGDQLCYGLSDLDLMVVDFHVNLSGGSERMIVRIIV